MQAELKNPDLHPDPATLPADATEFSLLARMIVGPAKAPGEASFAVTVCTPEWLASLCSRASGIYDPRHHLVVNRDSFDQRALHAWLSASIQDVESGTRFAIGEKLSRLGYCELEDSRA